MKKRYTGLQFKRFLIKFPAAFLVTILTIAIIVVAAGLALKSDGEDAKQKISVAITGNIENTYLEVGVFALQNLDSTRFTLDFQTMSLEDAKAALEKNEINGYVEFPPGFVDAIERGENIPASYVMNKTAVNLGSVMTSEIVSMVSDLIVEVQGAVYSMRQIAKEEGITSGLGGRAIDMNKIVATKLLARGEINDIEIVGVKDNLSLGGYYLGAVIVMFLLLWGLSFSGTLGKKSIQNQRLLKISGVGEYNQIKSELLPFFVLTFGMILLFAMCAFVVVNPSKAPIDEMRGAGLFEYISFVIAILPAVAMICCMHFFIYELIDSIVGAVIFQIFLSLIGGYLSGCFYPDFFFPDMMVKVADLLPIGAGFSYIRKALTGSLSIGTFLLVCAYGIGFVALSVKVRKSRLAGDGR